MAQKPAKRAKPSADSPLQQAWTAAFKALPPKVQIGVVQARKQLGNASLLLHPDAPSPAIAAELAKRVKDWSPEGTSVSIARAGSGRLAIGFADAFDIVHAFEPDEHRCSCLQHNVGLLGKDWILVHGAPTQEEGDYLFALSELESDVLLVPLICEAHEAEQDGAKRHELGEEFVETVEMIVQGVFSKVQLLVALLPADFPLPRLHKAVAEIPRATKATALRPVPVGDHLILQPIKLGSWGGNLASHVPLEAPAAAAAAARPKKKAAAGGDRPLAKLRRFEAWVKRCLVSYAAEGAKRPGAEGAPLTWLDLACGRGAELEYLQVGNSRLLTPFAR